MGRGVLHSHAGSGFLAGGSRMKWNRNAFPPRGRFPFIRSGSVSF